MIPPRRIKMEGTTKIMKWKPERKFIKKNSLTQEERLVYMTRYSLTANELMKGSIHLTRCPKFSS